MEYSKGQKLISLINRNRKDDYYMVNKREKDNKRFFKCSCCGKTFDFKDSEDYVGAVEQWEQGDNKCYVCANGLGNKQNFPCHIKE